MGWYELLLRAPVITLRVFGVIVVAVEGLIVVVLLFKSAKKAAVAGD